MLHKLLKDTYTIRAWIRLISKKNHKPISDAHGYLDHVDNGVGLKSIERNKKVKVKRNKISCENCHKRKLQICLQKQRRKSRNRVGMISDDSTEIRAGILDHHS